jgi:hypothetical protein
MFVPAVVNDGIALDSSSSVIESAAGRQEELYRLVEDFIHQHNPPCIRIKRERMVANLLDWVLGRSFQGLTMRNELDDDLRTFVIHILGVDYGSSLVTGYFLTAKLGILIPNCFDHAA